MSSSRAQGQVAILMTGHEADVIAEKTAKKL